MQVTEQETIDQFLQQPVEEIESSKSRKYKGQETNHDKQQLDSELVHLVLQSRAAYCSDQNTTVDKIRSLEKKVYCKTNQILTFKPQK